MAIDWAAIKEIAVAAAAVTTAGVAVFGFNKWRSELAGRAHFDCARTVARCVYQLRRAIQDCRAPLISISEYPDKVPVDPFTSTPGEMADLYRHAYGTRYSKVNTALTELDTAALEAEALWGKQIETRIDSLRYFTHELASALNAFIDNERSNGENFESDKAFGKRMREIVSASRRDDTNDFTKRLNEAIESIDAELRKHLSRKD